jgi:DNA sulfur modification protein DndB
MAEGALFLPALRATMGDWIYYISFMRMGDIRDRIGIAEEIHKTPRLQDFIQRQLTNRSREIAEYLQTKQRFFNAIVVGVYGGAPDWFQLAIGSNDLLKAEHLPDYLEGSLGILQLSGSEKLFAIDGQHRVSGIREALTDNADSHLSHEEVCVIVVGHETTRSGMERTRRLFTTLNRYAKPVTSAEIIALDEDDLVAIVTREIVERQGLMNVRNVSLAKTKGISPADETSVTSIVTLYKCHDTYLGRKYTRPRWSKFKKRRPNDDTLRSSFGDAGRLWEEFSATFAPLKRLARSAKPLTVRQYRSDSGGHLLFRPVGLEAAVAAVVEAMQHEELEVAEAVRRLSLCPMEISAEPWAGLLWDVTGKRMLTREKRPKLATRLLLHLMGCRIRLRNDRREPEEQLRYDLASALNRTAREIKLPHPVL